MNSKSPKLSDDRIQSITASDRLEADKAKYVKTPQVREQRQNPAINATLSPILLRRSLPSHCSQNPEKKLSPRLSPSIQSRNLPQYYEQKKESSSFTTSTTPFSPTLAPQTFNQRTGHALHTVMPFWMPGRSVKSPTSGPQLSNPSNVNCKHSDTQILGEQNQDNEVIPRNTLVHSLPMRKISGKRLNRPDSLIMYRQKRDITLTEKENNDSGGGLVIRLLQSTPLLKRHISLAQGSSKMCSQDKPVCNRTQRRMEEPFVHQAPLFNNTQEEESKEESSLTSSYIQHFFESCGLEGSLLNLLDNVYQLSGNTPIGSVESVDRVSGINVAAHEEEREERTPVSVIERNARVIKWIYSCQNAKLNSSCVEKQKSRESTV